MASYYEKVAQEIIKQLKEGTSILVKPWKPGVVGNMPYNPTSGRPYNGMNAIWLASSGYSDPRWLTYKQAQDEGAQVRKGEKGTIIQYWKWQGERIARDDAGNVILDKNGQPKKETYRLANPQVFSAVVFNAEQVDGLKPLQPKEIPQWEIQENAEKVLNNSPVPIYYDQSNRAYYSSAKDEIHLPPREFFNSLEGFYAVALHEIGHSTGHHSRLNRDLANPFGSIEYAKEELRAEIASYMLGMELGIGYDPGQHTAYIQSWIKVLNDDPKEIFRASRDAQKIKDYVMSLIQEQEIIQVQDTQQIHVELLKSLTTDEAINTWNNLNSFASQNNLKAVLQNNINTQEGTDLHGYTQEEERYRPIFVNYLDDKGVETGIVSALFAGDGKTSPFYNGSRLDNSYFNNDDDWQREALNSVLALYKTHQQEKEQEQSLPINYSSLPGNDEVVFLAIPYAEKEQAKALAKQGGFQIKWDKASNCWTAPKNVDLSPLAKWINTNTTISNTDALLKQQEAKDNAIKDFKQAITDMGLIIDDDPIMNEKIHRVKVTGDKGNETSGAYAGFLNENGGIPGGYIQNFKTGERMNWRSNVALPKLTPEEKALMAKQQAEKKQAREAEEQKKFENAINILAGHLKDNMTNADDSHPYLVLKGVPAMPGMYIDNKGLDINGQHFSQKGDLIIPIVNMNGELVSAQSIKPDGSKSYLKGGHKQEGFFILGDIANSNDLIFAEGLATGETVHICTGKPVVVTFDSGNLIEVSKIFKDNYPDKKILIASDNDQLKTLELDPKGRPKKNAGLEAGVIAVELTKGQMLYPPLKMTDKGSDWNDYQALYGKEAVTTELNKAVAIAYRNFEVVKVAQTREEKQQKVDNKQAHTQVKTQTKKLSIS